VGIFMENGSGGFVSDLEFQGGAIGWRAGTQQYTARNLKFRGCTQAVQMIWDWGFNWQQIDVDGGSVAFNISGKGGITKQGIGSVSFIDCKFSNVPVGILTDSGSDAPPNMVIDNLVTSNVGPIVKTTDGMVILPAASTVGLWAVGQRFNGGQGSYQSGNVGGVPSRPESLLSGGSFFSRSRPQYEALGAGDFLIATAQGIKNDGTGDQTTAINSFLQSAVRQGKIAYFPAGIYQVQGTVKVPLGSKIQGSSWSQVSVFCSTCLVPVVTDICVLDNGDRQLLRRRQKPESRGSSGPTWRCRRLGDCRHAVYRQRCHCRGNLDGVERP